jgi:hypothetical protein
MANHQTHFIDGKSDINLFPTDLPHSSAYEIDALRFPFECYPKARRNRQNIELTLSRYQASCMIKKIYRSIIENRPAMGYIKNTLKNDHEISNHDRNDRALIVSGQEILRTMLAQAGLPENWNG